MSTKQPHSGTVSTAAPSGVDSFWIDDGNQTPEALIAWLDAKYARHGEDEDRQAADLLRKLVAAVPANNERAIVAGAKRQAKRLLRLTKKEPLKITALNEALGVVAQLHGYPHWQAMAAITPPAAAQEDSSTAARHGSPDRQTKDDVSPSREPCAHQAESFRIDSSNGVHRHELGVWVQHMKRQQGCINVFTSHLDAIDSSNAQKVSVDELLLINPILPPLGSKAMLPAQLEMLVTTILSVKGHETNYEAHAILTSTIEKVLQDSFAVTRINPSYQNDVASTTEWARRDGLVSVDAQELLEKQQPVSLFDAAVQLQLAGFEEEAWFFHTLEMPRISCIETELNKLIKHGSTAGLITAKECVDAWCRRWVRNNASRSSKPWTLTTRNPVVFEVDPRALDTEFPATTRWMLAVLMGHYRRTSLWITDHTNRLSHAAYDQPLVAPWAQSIPREQRDGVVSWHMDRSNELGGGPNIDLFDEMDGPLKSQIVEDTLRRLMYSGERMGVGVWLMLHNEITSSNRLKELLSHSLQGPLNTPAQR